MTNTAAAEVAVELIEEADITEVATEDSVDTRSSSTPWSATFEAGDNVVYPHHGAGVVLKRSRGT